MLACSTELDFVIHQKVAQRKATPSWIIYWETREHYGEYGVNRPSFPVKIQILTSYHLGLLPIFQWLISLERSPPATRNLLTIERLQGWSMLAYYPLEHLYYLGSKGIIPSSIPSPFSIFSEKKRRLALDPNKLGLWSCRFWAVYVVLHFAHLVEDRKLLKQRHSSIRKAKGTGLTSEEKKEMAQRWDAFWSEVIINLGYLPLTIHWYGFDGQIACDIHLFWPGRWKRGCSRMMYCLLLSSFLLDADVVVTGVGRRFRPHCCSGLLPKWLESHCPTASSGSERTSHRNIFGSSHSV